MGATAVATGLGFKKLECAMAFNDILCADKSTLYRNQRKFLPNIEAAGKASEYEAFMDCVDYIKSQPDAKPNESGFWELHVSADGGWCHIRNAASCFVVLCSAEYDREKYTSAPIVCSATVEKPLDATFGTVNKVVLRKGNSDGCASNQMEARGYKLMLDEGSEFVKLLEQERVQLVVTIDGDTSIDHFLQESASVSKVCKGIWHAIKSLGKVQPRSLRFNQYCYFRLLKSQSFFCLGPD